MQILASERSRVQASTSGRCNTDVLMQGSFSRRRTVLVQAKQRTFTKKEIVVGIDLGTTNSAVAYISDGKPICIPNSAGEPTTPSVVSVQPGGVVVVGQQARKQATLNPESTYYSVKRLIGRPFNDPLVQEELPRLAFKVGEDEEGAVTLACSNVGPGHLYPEEVSAQVLSTLLEDARIHTGCATIKKAVICVPAYFSDAQREATLSAGRLAGLDTVRLLREPVAAALAYGLDLRQDQTVLVFDLGGGTYDISLLEVGNGTVEVLSTGGDPHLGGDDWDAALVRWLEKGPLARAAAKGQSSTPLDVTAPRTRANLRALAEAAKMALTDAEQVVLRVPGAGPGGAALQVTLTRDIFEEVTAELWRRARLPLDQACWQAGVDLGEVVGELESMKQAMRSRGVPSWKLDTMAPVIKPRKRGALTAVLLVGGATRMPAVERFIKNMTGLSPVEGGGVDPDEAVALGAAVQAGILQGEVTHLMIMDQWQASLMRALAKLQLQSSLAARKAVEEQFDLEDAPSTEFYQGEEGTSPSGSHPDADPGGSGGSSAPGSTRAAVQVKRARDASSKERGAAGDVRDSDGEERADGEEEEEEGAEGVPGGAAKARVRPKLGARAQRRARARRAAETSKADKASHAAGEAESVAGSASSQ